MTESNFIDLWQTPRGAIELTPWLATRAKAIPVAKTTGEPDKRFKSARKFTRRMRAVAQQRWIVNRAVDIAVGL